MISFGGVYTQVPSDQVVEFIESRIPLETAFGWFRPKSLGDQLLNPRSNFNWFLNRPFKINSFYMPWGASRWGYAFLLVDGKMSAAIDDQNSAGNSLPFTIDDGVGNSITTNLFALPSVPISQILNVSPQLPLYLLPLCDERQRWWEVLGAPVSFTPYPTYPDPDPAISTTLDVVEGTTTWIDLYDSLATALGIALTVDSISPYYVFPSQGIRRQYQYLPELLDLVAASVGQRIVRNLDGTYNAYNASTAKSLMIAQANSFGKLAGGSINLGVVNA